MAVPRSAFLVRPLSSLSKVYAEPALEDPAVTGGSALKGEVYSFQVAYFSEIHRRGITVKVEGSLAKATRIRKVDLVPSEVPYLLWDEGMEKRSPGLFPDLLAEIPEDGLFAPPAQWRSVWLTVRIPEKTPAGRHAFTVRFEHDGKTLAKAAHVLKVENAVFRPSELIQTQWFHADCVATAHGVAVLSERWWTLVEAYLKNATDHHINMILTPLFTPPLDTKIGGERPTVQLVGVRKVGAKYAFDFKNLERWVKICDRAGVKYLEMSHLFTQWGAKCAPKIVAKVGNKEEKIFGWHTPAGGKAYRDFLDAFLPALVKWIDAKKIRDRVYFHVSDEPYLDALESYGKAVEIMRRHVGDFPIIDALSNVEFYKNGLVRKPVPANNHIEPFVEAKVKGLWTYYCVSQWKEVPNRFFNMASARNRIMGALLYKYDIEGFLHWGFNFWHRQYSLGPVDPYRSTDAGLGFPSGDAFLVYPGTGGSRESQRQDGAKGDSPGTGGSRESQRQEGAKSDSAGEDGPVDSLRHEVHRDGIQDLAALRLLEEKIGREKTVAFLETGLKKTLSMTEYPRDPKWILALRERINRKLAS